MPSISLTQSQLQTLRETLHSKKILSEATGWNTFFDVVGIVDPTGMVDLLNGISYFKQGDKLYGTLSMVSAIPYLGDLLAKPVMLGAKAGRIGLGGLKSALVVGDATKIAAEATKAGPATSKFVSSSTVWGPKLLQILEQGKNIPLIGGLFKTIEGWIKLFTDSAKIMSKTSKGLPKSAFRNFGINTEKGLLSRWWQRGLGFQKNIQLSRQLAKTKFWLGFLDKLGVANFVGPAEFERMYGSEETQNALETYASTEEGKQQYDEEVSNLMGDGQTQEKPTTTTQNQTSMNSDKLYDIFSYLITGPA